MFIIPSEIYHNDQIFLLFVYNVHCVINWAKSLLTALCQNVWFVEVVVILAEQYFLLLNYWKAPRDFVKTQTQPQLNSTSI